MTKLTFSVTAVLIVVIALAVGGPNTDTTGYLGEPPNEPLVMRLGPIPLTSMNVQFESVLNVAFAYEGNQAFVTVMCEMRNLSKDFKPAIIWLNVFAIPLFVIIGAVVYFLAGQYVVSLSALVVNQLLLDMTIYTIVFCVVAWFNSQPTCTIITTAICCPTNVQKSSNPAHYMRD
jgi:amino acid transporter